MGANDAAEMLEVAKAEVAKLEQALFDIYVALGEDTDGARTPGELFRPLRMEPAEFMVKTARDVRADFERENEGLSDALDSARADAKTAFDDRDAALQRLGQLSRLHEEATERLAAVRIALDRADERFAAREHGAVIMADFHGDVSRAISEHRPTYSEEDER